MRTQPKTSFEPAFEEIYQLFTALVASLDAAIQMLPAGEEKSEEFLRLLRARRAAESGAKLAREQLPNQFPS